RQHGQRESWTLLRRILNGQQRITATFRRADDCALHVRKATVAESAQREIYQALGISETPGGIQKTTI
ncbi:MAG: transposase, partial [Gammaproteobacteria bacterium]|nr:transposase [Gammaproteobacteria bacterium]